MIKREVIIGDCRLLLGDCLEILPTLGKVDAVISDPPFEEEAHTLGRRLLGRSLGGGARELVTDAALSFAPINDKTRRSVAAWCAEMCGGWALLFCQAEAVTAWRNALEEGGARFKRAMVWVKPDAMPQYNGQGPAQGYESIAAAWCGEGHSRWNGGGRPGIFTYNKNSGGKHVHETQKPVPLMQELVRLFSDADGLVFDPFMGSGTTGVACVNLGRKFIGIEIEPKYYEIALRRIEEAYKQPRLFTEPKPQPKQEILI